MLNSVKHVGATKKSRIIGEVASEGGRIWRDYCIVKMLQIFCCYVYELFRVIFSCYLRGLLFVFVWFPTPLLHVAVPIPCHPHIYKTASPIHSVFQILITSIYS